MRIFLKLFISSMMVFVLSASVGMAQVLTPQQQERDRICILAAYSVVLSDWQNPNEKVRGYNIGSVLVSPDNHIVSYARNCVYETKNNTQHGEVRLMTQYLAKHNISTLPNYTIYTTLEPCAMCSGMMFLTGVTRTVYGQKDPAFGGAIERLHLDSKKRNNEGYTPYPDLSTRFTGKPLTSDRSDLMCCAALELAYKKAKDKSGKPLHITAFLTTREAKGLYEYAARELSRYRARFPENKPLLLEAKKFVPKHMQKGKWQ